MSEYLIAHKSDAAVPLELTIDQEGVGGVVGQSPTVAVRDAATANSYLDWADLTFKAAGWITKYGGAVEVERGHYRRPLDLSAVPEIVPGMVLAIEFHVDDGGTIIGDDMDHLLVGSEIAQTALVAAGATPTVVPTNLTEADGFFVNMQGIFVNATGAVARNIDAYAAAGGTITVTTLPFVPAAGDTVVILARTGSVPVDAAAIAIAVWEALAAAHMTLGTFGRMVNEIRVEEEEDDFRVEGG